MIQSLDRTRTGKSISIALAFALRACVRAKLRARDDSAVAGGGLINFVGRSGWPASRSGAVPGPLWVIVFRIHALVLEGV